MPNEADTCRTFVVPKLQAAGWDADPHSIAEQRTLTDGRIFPLKDERGKRGKPKRAASNRFHLGVQPNGEEITMLAFEWALAIADEKTVDLARALLATPPEHILAQTNRILRLCRSR